MPNQRQPVELIQYKGRKHLTKAEIRERAAGEVETIADDIRPPSYLNKKQREEFDYLAEQLQNLDIFGNVDVGMLARYCVAHSMYEQYTKRLRTAPRKKVKLIREQAEETGEMEKLATFTDDELALELETKLTALQHRYFTQCDQCARSLGMTITSRCRLVIPKAPEAPRENKFSKFEKMG